MKNPGFPIIACSIALFVGWCIGEFIVCPTLEANRAYHQSIENRLRKLEEKVPVPEGGE